MNRNVFQIDQMRINELKIHGRNCRCQFVLNPPLQEILGAEFSASTRDKVDIFAKSFQLYYYIKFPGRGKKTMRNRVCEGGGHPNHVFAYESKHQKSDFGQLCSILTYSVR